MSTVQWHVSAFDALGPHQLYAILLLRTDVFVVEQQCAYPELDGQDATALHLTGWIGDALAAYARILPPGADGLPHIGRVVVHPAHRGKGLGQAVMHEAVRNTRERFGPTPIAISAQAHLQAFYARMGFTATSAAYPWDGIPHVDMVLSAAK